MKLALLISEEVKSTLSKLAKEQLPFDACLKLMDIIDIAKQKEKELDDLRIELLLKYGNKDSEGEMLLTENGSVQIEESNAAKLTEELSVKYNEEIELPAIEREAIVSFARLTYTGEELIRIGALLLK